LTAFGQRGIMSFSRAIQQNTLRSASMAIGVYFHPESLTAEKYDDAVRRLTAAGAGTPKGRVFHSCFGESGSLSVYEVWESQADLDAFGATLMPILATIGIDPGTPDIVPMHNLIMG
jgi:hypothetical protein